MRSWVRRVTIVLVAVLALLPTEAAPIAASESAATVHARYPATTPPPAVRVGGFRPETLKVRFDRPNGTRVWRQVTASTRVFLRDSAGNRTVVDADQLVRGANVVGRRVVGGRVVSVTVQERNETGVADCSFDTSSSDGDSVGDDESFECSHDYDDGVVSTDTDCSFDSSRDGSTRDWSLDASWDCSYSEVDERDDDAGLDWDCSFSASAGGYSDASGGDADADLDFDCSWDGASTVSPLWSCRFLPRVLGFHCVSTQLGQEFGYTIDRANMTASGGVDFQQDVIGTDEVSGGDGVGCEGSAADGYDCSLSGEYGSGDCSVDWSFDRSRATESGDVSGSLSYSCSWDS